MCHTLPPEPFPSLDSIFPVDCYQIQTLAFSPPPPYDNQTVDPLFHPEATLSVNTVSPLSQDMDPLPDLYQTMNPTDSFPCPQIPPSMSVAPPPDCNLTVTPSKSISILSIPIPESSSPGSPGGLFTYDPRTSGIHHSSLSTSDCSWGQDHANEEFLALHSSEDSFRRDPAAITTESGNLSFLSRDALALLERQVCKKSDFVLWKEKEKKGGSFPKQLRPEYQLNSPGKILQLLISMTQQSPFLFGTAKANQRSCMCTSSSHILRPWGANYSKKVSSSLEAPHLYTVSPCPLLPMAWVTIP